MIGMLKTQSHHKLGANIKKLLAKRHFNLVKILPYSTMLKILTYSKWVGLDLFVHM